MSVHWKREKRQSNEGRLCKNCKRPVTGYRGAEAVLYHTRTGSAYCNPKAPWPRKHAE